MLTAIGLILILKQIPHALGWDKDLMGDLAFRQMDEQNTFSEIWYAIQYFSPGAIPIVLVALGLIIFFEKPKIKNHKIFGLVPGALWAVIAGILINQLYGIIRPSWKLDEEHLVSIPDVDQLSDLSSLVTFPDFGMIGSLDFWLIAVTVAVIASIETLLSLEAGDKMDPQKRLSPSSRELVAQGAGNTLSGLIGGLPVTAVIVRTTANITSGAKTKLSAICHGILLLVLVIGIAELLNLIPLSCLAAVLFFVGYKLAKPSVFVHEYEKGMNQFIPFMVTISAILFTDLLIGIGIGMIFGIFFVIRTNYQKSVSVTELDGMYLVKLQKDVSFLNKAPLMRHLAEIPNGSDVVLNATRARFIDHDIQEVLNDFIETSTDKNITITIEGFNYKLKES
jgi:MFS superfamily sulfate permease-like transporter